MGGTGEITEDRRIILEALAKGRAFIGYDPPASTTGFRFNANTLQGNIGMGEEASSKGGVTLQIRLPKPVECRLVYNGTTIKNWNIREIITYNTTEPGVYRVEAYINYLGKTRGWIFSNPIFITK